MGQGWTDAFPEAVWREAFRQASVGLAMLDGAGVPVAVNEHLERLLGPEVRDVVGQAVQSRLALLERDPAVVPLDERVAARVEPIELGCADGSTERFFLLYLVPPVGTDPLTGLAGRDQLMAQLTRLLGRRDRRPVEVVMVDLDDFKRVNDRHGHLVGDEVLMAVAERLTGSVRPDDIVSRWGGDEFVVLLDAPDPGGAQVVCARIAAALTRPVRTRAGDLVMSASCGCAGARAGESPAELLDRADRQMYRAKGQRVPTPRPGTDGEVPARGQRGQLAGAVRARLSRSRGRGEPSTS